MKTLEANLSDRSSDRHVLLATLLSGLAVALMLTFELLGRFHIWEEESTFASSAEILSEVFALAAITWAGAVALRVIRETRAVSVAAVEASHQVETLFKMTDMLQSALGYGDANAVLRTTASKLLPNLGGALYVFNNSGDRLELSTYWAFPEGQEPIATIAPTQCWALKRGKEHLNLAGPGALRCPHNSEDAVLLEIPMMARGEVYGLLQVQASGADPESQLKQASPVAAAIADAMSLALSNIALREKLRTQALRDPLTGLYNRRYMEDVLERYAGLAERNQSDLSVLMFDLDHFKRLNDEHGHALGDAVLTSVAAAVLSTIRPSDIACRYGGEEFVVLLPDCAMDEAATRAETLRTRIERVSENHGVRVSASFGIASIPQSSSKVTDVLGDADAALYRAKAEGRNRACLAELRPTRSVPESKAA
jgi:diguanylate cyclase (GGDEF)-like protein